MRALALLLVSLSLAHGWGGEHQVITGAATALLPPAEAAWLAPETSALAEFYCTFPDQNWANQGEWGEGVGNPGGRRLPDFRREWEVSAYLADDPVVGPRTRLNHAPPESISAVGRYFEQAAGCFAAGRLEDGARVAGVMLHYAQDSGSMPHLQPFHRHWGVRDQRQITLADYRPALLSADPAAAPAAAARRVAGLVRETEQQLGAFLAPRGHDLEQLRERCARELAPADLMALVAGFREGEAAAWQALTLSAALETTRVCADLLHTLLQGYRPAAVPPAPTGRNMVANPSFEDDTGDGVPDGWCVGWRDLADRGGRAEWYRAGTHWERHVHHGLRSALLLWAPTAGLEWRQSWPHAVRVEPGQRWRASAWVESRGRGGAAWLELRLADTAYHVLTTARSEPVRGEAAWQQLNALLDVPAAGKWLRLALCADAGDGAVWFDEVALVRD